MLHYEIGKDHPFAQVAEVAVGGGHYRGISTFRVQPAPSVWDASSEAEFRVAFMFFAGGGGINPNRLTVSLAHVSWELSLAAGPGTLRLDPYGYGLPRNFGQRVPPQALPASSAFRLSAADAHSDNSGCVIGSAF